MIESFSAAIATATVEVVRDLLHPVRQRLEELVQRRQAQASRLLQPCLQAFLRRRRNRAVVKYTQQRVSLVRQLP